MSHSTAQPLLFLISYRPLKKTAAEVPSALKFRLIFLPYIDMEHLANVSLFNSFSISLEDRDTCFV